MENADLLLLARAQFGLNIGFHILFPTHHHRARLDPPVLPLRIRAAPGDAAWLATYKLWTKIFALTFAMGVVTGIIMSFQFGTNWPGFMEKVGNIAGPLLGYEVLTAFFLEATFLGVMLFGMNRVAVWVHIFSAAHGGDRHDALRVLDLGAELVDADAGGPRVMRRRAHRRRLVDVDLQPIVAVSRHAHAAGFGLTAAFLLAGLSAWRCCARPPRGARATLRARPSIAAVLIPLQIFVGDLHGLNTLEHQPAKIAAMEGSGTPQRGAPLVLFAVPNEDDAPQRLRARNPAAGKPDPAARCRRRSQGPGRFRARYPPVLPVFFAFRVMVGIGVLMLVARVGRRMGDAPRRAAARWLLWTFAALLSRAGSQRSRAGS